MELKDKIVVITGGASGIGRALAVRFHEEGAKKIVVVDMNLAGAEETSEMIDGVAMQADVSSENDIKAVIENTESHVGPIDLFCSNAGIGTGKDLQSPNEQWQKIWDVNVMSHVYAARHLVPRMVERGGGYFLNTSSAAGLLNQIGGCAYGVTKHCPSPTTFITTTRCYQTTLLLLLPRHIATKLLLLLLLLSKRGPYLRYSCLPFFPFHYMAGCRKVVTTTALY